MAAILVVDDEPLCRELLQRLLTMEGHTVFIVADGAEVIPALTRRDFDLILLDLMMPVMKGSRVLAALGSDCRWKHVPIIVVTAIAEPSIMLESLLLGARSYMLKSRFSFDDLLTCIARHLPSEAGCAAA